MSNQFAAKNLTVGQLNAVVKKMGGAENVMQFLRGELVIKTSDLLRCVSTVEVCGTKHFVAKDHLKEAKVGLNCDKFKDLFIDKVEEDVEDAILVISDLERGSLDVSILAELGYRAETSLAYLFALLKKQNKGEEGPLLTNGLVNIFYVRGTDGNLWALLIRWVSGVRYWLVKTYSVGQLKEWAADWRVFSRNS